MIKYCKLCNNEFHVNEKLKIEINKLFCSRHCSCKFNGLQNKGRKHSNEVKEKMSRDRQGTNNNFFGKKHSNETKKLIGEKNSIISSKKVKTCEFDTNQLSAITGMLLADGCISSVSKFSARISYGCKFKETIVKIINTFSNINFSNINKYTSKPHKKTNNESTCFFINSHSYNTLLDIRNKWYINSKKLIPKDIILNDIVCYWWFIGDGYVSDNSVHLCTDSFTKEDNLFLIEKLKELNFDAYLSSKNRICLYKKSSEIFLNWIKPLNNLDIYDYKWKKFINK